MKKLIFSLLLFPATAFCAHHVSVHGGSDYTKLTNEKNGGQKIGYCLGGSYGYDVNDNWKAEAEVTYREGHKRTRYEEDKKIYRSRHNWAYMVNLCYNVNQLAFQNLTPYLGIGGGYCNSVEHFKTKVGEEEAECTKQRDTDFAWQGFIGVKYPVAENYALNARYCYFVGEAHTKSHAVRFGLERAF